MYLVFTHSSQHRIQVRRRHLIGVKHLIIRLPLSLKNNSHVLWNVLTTDERSWHCDCVFISGEKTKTAFCTKKKKWIIIMIKIIIYLSMCYEFCPNLNLFLSVKKKERKKKENALPSVKKIANKINASFLIQLCRGNWDKAQICVLLFSFYFIFFFFFFFFFFFVFLILFFVFLFFVFFNWAWNIQQNPFLIVQKLWLHNITDTPFTYLIRLTFDLGQSYRFRACALGICIRLMAMWPDPVTIPWSVGR